MFQRFASVFFGDEMEEVSVRGPGERGFGRQDEDEEEDEEWILVDYLAEACSAPRGDALSGLAVAPEQEDDEEDLVMVPSPEAGPRIRYSSCISLNSTSDTDPDGGPEEEEEEEEGDGGFLQLEACSLEESWFVTPPPCFTGRGSKPVPLEASPLENLLIEHPSMSVYAASRPRPRSPLTRDLALPPAKAASAAGKETGRRSLDAPRHRPDVAVVQRHASLHSACYVATLSARAGVLDQAQQAGRLAQRAQPPSRKALHRLNLLRHPGGAKQAKTAAMYLHQPGHRHLNY